LVVALLGYLLDKVLLEHPLQLLVKQPHLVEEAVDSMAVRDSQADQAVAGLMAVAQQLVAEVELVVRVILAVMV
jgi:hypothetical protein